MSVRPYLAHCLLLQIKIYWRTAMPIHLRLSMVAFIPQQNVTKRDHMSSKAKIPIIDLLQENFPTSAPVL